MYLKNDKIIFIHSFGPAWSSGHSLDVSNHQCQQAAATQCNIITTLLCLSLNLGGGHNTLSMVLSARTCTWLASPSTKNDRHYFNVQHLFIFFLKRKLFWQQWWGIAPNAIFSSELNSHKWPNWITCADCNMLVEITVLLSLRGVAARGDALFCAGATHD